jgi:serine/threonine-protein kinase ATR
VLDGEHAALIGIHIFSLLSRVGAAQKNIPVIRSITDNLASAQHSLSKMWSTLHLWESLPMLNDKASVIRVGILEALSTTLDNQAFSKYNPKLDGLYFFAVRCMVDTIKRPMVQMDHHTEHAMTGILLSLMSIYRHSPLIQELLKDRLYPPVFALISDGSRSQLLRQDTQVALLKLVVHMSLITGEQRHLATVNAQLKELTDGDWNCKDENLNKRLEAVLWEESVESPMYDFEGPRKRLRLDNSDDVKQFLIKRVYSLLGSQEALDIAGLSQVAAEGFKQLSEEDRCTAVRSLGLLVCAEAGDLHGSRVKYGHVYKCSYCDSDAPILKLTRNYADAHDAELLGTMEAIHKMDKFTESPKIRALGLETLRRMINHTRDLTHLNLENSQLGMWCLSLLQSRRRELRIAAGYVLYSRFGGVELTACKADNTVLRELCARPAGVASEPLHPARFVKDAFRR